MFEPRFTRGANVLPTGAGWHLQIPEGAAGIYRLAQLDDYAALPRSHFPLKAPASLRLRSRVSQALTPGPSPQSRGELPGTWGFGFWNDPFAFSFGLQGKAQRLPALPNACWFFHASKENHLSFNDSLPGNGFLAQCFRSARIPPALLAPAAFGLPMLFSKIISRWIRAVAGRIIGEDSRAIELDETQWHTYQLSWRESEVIFSVDDVPIFETSISPHGPLAVVIWIDNQYAAWTPEGRLGFGTLPNRAPAWMEVEQVEIESEQSWRRSGDQHQI